MPSIKINFNEIRELIPHREPFLFLDELIDIIKLKKATGIKTFSKEISLLPEPAKPITSQESSIIFTFSCLGMKTPTLFPV